MKRLLSIFLFVFVSINCFCQEVQEGNDVVIESNVAEQESAKETNDWETLISAIMKVESSYDKNAYNKDGKCAGILQITPVLVAETNRISAAYKMGKKYTLDDRFNIEKSVEMFNIIQDFYNKDHDIERAIRLWNGGPGYGMKSTQRYYENVMREYKALKDK